VAERPDYKPTDNYVTARQRAGQPQMSTPEPLPTGDQGYRGGLDTPRAVGAPRPPSPQTSPTQFVLNRDRQNNQPGGSTIPSSVLWKTGW
jgi:hypothetical protein